MGEKFQKGFILFIYVHVLGVNFDFFFFASCFFQTLAPLGKIVKRAPFRFLKPFQEYTSLGSKVSKLIGIEYDENGEPTIESLVRGYEAWSTHVQSSVQKERLLVHSAKDGFGPLCAFLGVEEPVEPYPHINDSDDLLKQILVLDTIAKIWPFFSFALVLALVLSVMSCCRRRDSNSATKFKNS